MSCLSPLEKILSASFQESFETSTFRVRWSPLKKFFLSHLAKVLSESVRGPPTRDPPTVGFPDTRHHRAAALPWLLCGVCCSVCFSRVRFRAHLFPRPAAPATPVARRFFFPGGAKWPLGPRPARPPWERRQLRACPSVPQLGSMAAIQGMLGERF